MNIKVHKYQSYLDLAIQATGEISNVFAIAGNNSITDIPLPGIDLEIADIRVNINRKVKNYFEARGLKPASGNNIGTMPRSEGIGFWYIDDDFAVTSEL